MNAITINITDHATPELQKLISAVVPVANQLAGTALNAIRRSLAET